MSILRGKILKHLQRASAVKKAVYESPSRELFRRAASDTAVLNPRVYTYFVC